MPGGFKTNTAHASTYSNLIDSGQNTSVTRGTPAAASMRATNVTNPFGSSFEVAGPTVGGAAMSNDSQNIEQPCLSNTVKAKATTATTGAAAAGATVIAAAKKLINHNDGNDDYGHYDVKDKFLPISNQSAIGSGGARENHEFSEQTSAIKPIGPMDRLPDEDATQIPMKKPLTQYNMSGNVSTPSDSRAGRFGTGAAAGAAATGLGATALGNHYQPTSDTSEVKRIPIAQPPSDILSDSSMDPKAVAATIGTTAAGKSAATYRSPTPHTASIVDRVEEIFHIKHHAIPKDSSHQYAMTNAKVLLNQQEYATKAAGMKVGHEHLLPIRHNTTTIATYSAPPQIYEVQEYVPEEYLEHFPHHPYEDAFKTGAPVAAAAGAGAYMGSKMTMPHNKGVVDTTMLSSAGERATSVPTGTTSSDSTPTGDIRRLVVKPVDDTRQKTTTAASAPKFDTRYMGNERSTAAPAAVAAATAAGALASSAQNTTETHRTLGEKIKDALGMHDTNSLTFTDPKTLRPVTDVRTIPVPAETYKRPLTEKVKDILHLPSEYGPADPKDLNLTDPRTLRPMGEKIAAGAVAGATIAGAATAAKSSHRADAQAPEAANTTAMATGTASPATLNFTDPKTLRPVTDVRTIPVPAKTYKRPLTEKIKDILHLPSEYGPADPKDLNLTDPRTLRPMGEKIAAGAAAGAATAVKPSHSADVQAPKTTNTTAMATETANPTALNFTDPKTLRPLTDNQTIPITAETQRRTQTENVKEVAHLPSEYGPADPRDLKLTDPKTILPMGEKIAAPAAAAAATTAAAIGVKEATKTNTATNVSKPTTTTPAINTPSTPATNISKPTTTTPVVNTASAPAANISKPTTTTTVSNTPTATATMKPSSAMPAAAATATGAAVVGVAAMNSHNSNNITPISATDSSGGITNRHIDSANRVASAIPVSYSGPVPQVKPGEDVVWMKTTTTTTFYSGDVNEDVTIQQQTTPAPNAQTQNGQTHASAQRHHSSGGFFRRLMGRRSSSNKGKQRL
ncbi:hypothetical protein BGZ58_005995 [Dissophora ornata]|nr:hypothetical protein BGZ58_005995 [Dissophora ornata]